MREDEFEALLEVIEAMWANKQPGSGIEEAVRFSELKQEFINVQIFGDEPEENQKWPT